MTDTTDPYKSTEWAVGSLGFLFFVMGAGYYSTASDTRLPLVFMIGGGLLAAVSARAFWLTRRRQK